MLEKQVCKLLLNEINKKQSIKSNYLNVFISVVLTIAAETIKGYRHLNRNYLCNASEDANQTNCYKA